MLSPTISMHNSTLFLIKREGDKEYNLVLIIVIMVKSDYKTNINDN